MILGIVEFTADGKKRHTITYGYLCCSSNCWKPACTVERLCERCDVSVGSFPDNSPTPISLVIQHANHFSGLIKLHCCVNQFDSLNKSFFSRIFDEIPGDATKR